MKHFVSFVFALAFVLNNANARDTVYIQDGDPSNRSYVLWRVQFQPGSGMIDVKIDSVLRGHFRTDEKWLAHPASLKEFDINMNANYLVLTNVVRFYSNALFISKGGSDILPDTHENRKKLSKKWDEAIVIYKNPKPSILQKPDHWFGENPTGPKDTIKNSDLPIEHALLKVTIKNPNADVVSVYADTVFLGKIRDGSFVIYSPNICTDVVAGEYLVLARDFVTGDLIMHAIYDKCPIKDTPENRQKLAKEWEKCQAWGKMKNRAPVPKGQFCGETKE